MIYHVHAGKYYVDDNGDLQEDCKYAQSFFTSQEAIEAWRQSLDYPYARILECEYAQISERQLYQPE
jgi:hypothetical protein